MTLRVLVFGAWDDGPGYPRTRAWLQGLDAVGHAPTLWRVPSPWSGQRKIDVVRQPWRWPRAACQLLAMRRRTRDELSTALRQVQPDVVVVPYPGHTLVPVVRAAFSGAIVLDLFLPAHDTAVEDRAYFAVGSLPARALRALDRRACAAADLVLLDTPAHAAHVALTLGLTPSRTSWVPVGDPDAPSAGWLYPPLTSPLRLLFFGTGVPLHGLGVLVEAVHACAGAVRLEVIGGSPREREAVDRLASPHVALLPGFVTRRDLDVAMARAHVITGVFGTSSKAQRVVPFKVVHGLAAGRPVLTGDTPAVREWLTPGADVLLAPMGDASALAECLRALARAPEVLPAIAAAARSAFDRRFSSLALGERMRELLAGVLAPPAAALPTAAMVEPR